MAGERNPGPLSQMERPIEIGDNTLPRTEMPRPGPVGLDAGPAKGAPKATAVKELNIAGEFPWQPSITDAEEIAELSANRWMPGTDDFVAVPAGTVPVAPTFGNALGRSSRRRTAPSAGSTSSPMRTRAWSRTAAQSRSRP